LLIFIISTVRTFGILDSIAVACAPPPFPGRSLHCQKGAER